MKKNALKSLLFFSASMASMHLINTYIFKNTMELKDTLDGETDTYFSPIGKVYYTKKGNGEPLLLIHGINIGASSAVWKKVYDLLSMDFTVYALDLPGFGMSQKLPVIYRSYMYRDLIKVFIKDFISEPTNVLSCGLSSAYCIQSSLENQDYIKKIAAVCPTGIFSFADPPSNHGKILAGFLRLPIVGTFTYNMFVSFKAAKYYHTDEGYKHRARQNRYLSKYAPSSLIGGYLNLCIADAFFNSKVPVAIFCSDESKSPFSTDSKYFKDLRSDIRYHVFPRCKSPQEEYPEEFARLCRDFFIPENSKTII